jgi:RNA-directed DNA polymerase
MRITDRSVLQLIRMWLESPVVEGGGSSGEPEKWSRSGKGTPQGGVISPLLANLYLHWFDKTFHWNSGPAVWAKAKLVRYADDFVVLAPRYVGTKLTSFIEDKLETWLGLEINREKTRVVNLKEKGASLDFLGFTFRYYNDLKGQGYRYLNVSPSAKAMKKEREKLRELTGVSQTYVPLPTLIQHLNRHLDGWANYFRFGYPRVAFREINWYVRDRLKQHLRRRSQRPFRPPEGSTYYQHLNQMGLRYL